MLLRFKTILRFLLEEVITERLAPMEKRQDQMESVVEGVFSKITWIDNNSDYMAKRFRDEDEAKSKSNNALLGGVAPSREPMGKLLPGRQGLTEGLISPLEDWGHRRFGSQHFGY